MTYETQERTRFHVAIRYNAANSVGPSFPRREKETVIDCYAITAEEAVKYATTCKDFPESVVIQVRLVK